MWRTKRLREESATERLKMALTWWRWQPHEAQKKLFCAGASVRIAACGRRWGKTESLSIDIASLALTERGSRQLLVAPTEMQARLLGEAVQDRLEKAFAAGSSGLEDRSLVVRARPHLTLTITPPLPGGEPSQILCRTAGRDGRNLRGLWAHRIIVDEAAHVPDRVLREVLPPMLADKGGEYLLASSPNGRRSAFYSLFARGSVPGSGKGITYQSFQCPTTDNKAHLDKAWLASQREDMGEALYAQEFDAQFLDDFGMVFREEEISAAITDIPGVRLERTEVLSEPIPGHYYVVGIDWGRKWDYTVVSVLDTETCPAKLVHLSRWRGTGWETQAIDAAAIIARFQPRRVIVDGNGIGDPIAEMLDTQVHKLMPKASYQPTVERFNFGTESKQHLIDRLNIALSARAIQFPPHKALLHELRCFEYAPGGPGSLKMAAQSGGHDDCVISLALAFYAAPDAHSSREPGLGILLGSQGGVARRE
ncbi:MAG: terminase large subunit domain-containing protein [Janthinobacterium lividum]